MSKRAGPKDTGTLPAGWSVGKTPAAVHGRTSWDTTPATGGSRTLGSNQLSGVRSALWSLQQFPWGLRLDLNPLTSTWSLQGLPLAPLTTDL